MATVATGYEGESYVGFVISVWRGAKAEAVSVSPILSIWICLHYRIGSFTGAATNRSGSLMSQISHCGPETSLLTPSIALVNRQRICGFTLIELMVTLAVAVVLIAVAVPSFRNITISNKLTTTANDVVGAINVARMEAIRLNANTQLCSNSTTNNGTDALGVACTTQTGAVWGMVPAATTGTPTATLLRVGTSGIAAPVALTGNMAAIRFGSNGLGHGVSASTPFDGLVADISSDALSANNHRCIRVAAGSIITTTPQTGACPP